LKDFIDYLRTIDFSKVRNYMTSIWGAGDRTHKLYGGEEQFIEICTRLATYISNERCHIPEWTGKFRAFQAQERRRFEMLQARGVRQRSPVMPPRRTGRAPLPPLLSRTINQTVYDVYRNRIVAGRQKFDFGDHESIQLDWYSDRMGDAHVEGSRMSWDTFIQLVTMDPTSLFINEALGKFIALKTR
jgi:hypothetical protein